MSNGDASSCLLRTDAASFIGRSDSMNDVPVLTGQKYWNEASNSVWRVLGRDLAANPPTVRMVDDARPTVIHTVPMDDLHNPSRFRRQP
jgi:hypothetical protein